MEGTGVLLYQILDITEFVTTNRNTAREEIPLEVNF